MSPLRPSNSCPFILFFLNCETSAVLTAQDFLAPEGRLLDAHTRLEANLLERPYFYKILTYLADSRNGKNPRRKF